MAHETEAGTPDFEVLSGSSVASAGEVETIPPHLVPLAPSHQPGTNLRSVTVLDIPQVGLAFGDFIDVHQNQEFLIDLDTTMLDSTLSFPVWVIDSAGNRLELSADLTTGTPTTRDCTNYRYCFGTSGDLPRCSGSPWDPATGNTRFVGIVLIPANSGTIIECEELWFVIEARILPGNADADTHEDVVDNCPDDTNEGQEDGDSDGIGDVCDNCPAIFNPDQGDFDGDSTGDACQPYLVNFQPFASVVPPSYLKDYGAPYDLAVDYGWLTSFTLQSRDRNVDPDQRLDTFVYSSLSENWEFTLPGDQYDVVLQTGDATNPQGPHRVDAEGTRIVNDVSSAAGEYLFGTLAEGFVADGRLTLSIGGGGGNTMLNYVDITASGSQPFAESYVNFQPGASAAPPGFDVDSGAPFSGGTGYGWDVSSIESRDRNILDDPALDTFVFTAGTPRTWEIDVPADFYRVQLAIGDAQYGQGPQRVAVEGELWADGASTAPGEFLTLTGNVLVLDRRLTVDIGQMGGTTTLNYVSLMSLPRDLDGDGVVNFSDNCFEIPNPSQTDTDGNGVGDLCNDAEDADGDEFSDVLDNCPLDFNPAQVDGDEDDWGDDCDCAPADQTVFAGAGEVTNVRASDENTDDVLWDSQRFTAGMSTVYDIVTQSILSLGDTIPYQGASCLVDDHPASDYTDTKSLSAGDGFLYLIRAENSCGSGDYGAGTGSPNPRDDLNSSGPCP